MIKHTDDGETFAAAEVPRSEGSWFDVDDYWAAEGGLWSGVEVEGAVEVLPDRYGRGDVGLAD